MGVLLLMAADISAGNVDGLKEAWRFQTQAKPPGKRAAAVAAFEATPVLAGNMVYVITPFNQVIALTPDTGKEVWRYDPVLADDDSYSEASARGVTVADGRLFFGTLDARLIALDAATGKRLWQAQIGPHTRKSEYQVTSPPVVVNGAVVVGCSISDNQRAKTAHGVVNAFDARTGERRWQWDATPPGETGAANAWAPMSADAGRDMVFVPTGSASPDFYGGLRPGDNRFANSVVALQASTGRVVWAFQVVHHDLWDYDVASRPELIEIGGRPAVGVLTKVGHYFALDRLSGRPLLPVEERAVPKSDVAGEQAAATQPFPVTGIFAEQKFAARPGWCTDALQKVRYDGLFSPPSLQGTLEFPGNVGGANWGSGAYVPSSGLLVVAANRLGTIVRLIPRDTFDGAGHGDTGERLGLEYGAQAGTPYGMARRTFLGPDGMPCNEQPWGELVAIDVASGQVRWRVPESVSLGGPLVVNDVVFFAANVFEEKIRAYSAESGKKLWEAALPYPANSVPGTYVWQGKRYVVVCAGGHGKVDGSHTGDAVIAYRLK